MDYLQSRRVATRAHDGKTYGLGNKELHRILMNTFASTTLNNVVRTFQRQENNLGAWKSILDNVEGTNYVTELKRQGDSEVGGVFFDPTKNFTI